MRSEVISKPIKLDHCVNANRATFLPDDPQLRGRDDFHPCFNDYLAIVDRFHSAIIREQWKNRANVAQTFR